MESLKISQNFDQFEFTFEIRGEDQSEFQWLDLAWLFQKVILCLLKSEPIPQIDQFWRQISRCCCEGKELPKMLEICKSFEFLKRECCNDHFELKPLRLQLEILSREFSSEKEESLMQGVADELNKRYVQKTNVCITLNIILKLCKYFITSYFGLQVPWQSIFEAHRNQ